MLVYLIAILSGIAFALAGQLTFWPVTTEAPFHFWRPIILLVAGYFIGIGIAWIFYDISGRLTVSYKKDYRKPTRFARRLLTDGITFINIHAHIKLKKIGLDKIPNEPFLLIGNHKSKFDPMLVAQVFHKRYIAFITKQDNMKIPLAARFMWRLGYMPVDRSDKLQSLEQFKKAAELISTGASSVGVYPEGSRQPADVILADFHNGCFNIAIKAKCPIVVLVTKGTEKIHKRFPRKTNVEMKCLQVLYYEDYANMNATELSTYVHDIMYKELSGE